MCYSLAAVSQTDTLKIYNGQMDCKSAQFSVSSLSWPESEVSLAVKDGRLSTTLQAANGSVNIQKLKETVTSISALAGKENPAANWPNVMQYQSLLVNASLQDEQVIAEANLDNLHVAMRGTLARVDGALNLEGALTVERANSDQLVQLDPLFTDLPLPFYCQGTLAEPDCGPDPPLSPYIYIYIYICTNIRLYFDLASVMCGFVSVLCMVFESVLCA